VLPTPPFWLAIAKILATCSDSSDVCRNARTGLGDISSFSGGATTICSRRAARRSIPHDLEHVAAAVLAGKGELMRGSHAEAFRQPGDLVVRIAALHRHEDRARAHE